MNFSVLDHYNGFILNNFIKKDNSQIDLLNKISLTWNQYNKNNLFFSKNKKEGIYNIVSNKRISKYDFGKMVANKFGLDTTLIKKNKLLIKFIHILSGLRTYNFDSFFIPTFRF